MKLGRGPIATAVLAVAALGTYFGTNLVNPEQHVGIVAEDRALAVMDVDSEFSSGSTTNTVFLNSPFNADAADRGYTTGSGANVMALIEIVTNPTGASFDCYFGRADTGTGAGVLIATNISQTGTIVLIGSGHTVGPDRGYGCNTTDRIKSTTLLKGGGVFLRSAVLN